MRTILMLSVVFLVTLASWGSARLACNVTDPVNKPPPEVPLTRLAATPKHAAIELQHRWRTSNLKGALELAQGSLRKRLARELKQCEAEPVACRKRHAKLEGRVLTTATVLRQDERIAEVRVTSHIQGSGEERYLLTLKREGKLWKGTDRRPE